MSNYNPVANSALTTLIILQVIMLAALFAAVAPHPPAIIAPFAMAPFLAASLCVAAAAMILGPLNGPYGRGFSLLAAVMRWYHTGHKNTLTQHLRKSGPLWWQDKLLSQSLLCIACVQAQRP